MLYIMFIESNRNKTDKHNIHISSKQEVCVFSATYPNQQLMKHYEHKAINTHLECILYQSLLIRSNLQAINSLHIYINTVIDSYYNIITTDPVSMIISANEWNSYTLFKTKIQEQVDWKNNSISSMTLTTKAQNLVADYLRLSHREEPRNPPSLGTAGNTRSPFFWISLHVLAEAIPPLTSLVAGNQVLRFAGKTHY